MKFDGIHKSPLKYFLLYFSIVVLSISCAQPGWIRKDNGVVIRLKPENPESARLIRIEVLRDNIIHVSASPVNRVSEGNSLSVTGTDNMSAGFNVRQIIDSLMITTSELQIKVSLVSGQVVFCDQYGRIARYSRKTEDQAGYFYITGSNYDEVISGYRSVTGKVPIMPEWALGCWQCHERYLTAGRKGKNGDELNNLVLPRDSIVRCWAFNPAVTSGKEWDELHHHINNGINYSLLGTPYYTIDIDEFNPSVFTAGSETGTEDAEESIELYSRWYQFGSFCPLFRDNGELPSGKEQIIIKAGHSANEIRLFYSKLRYCLIPYYYSLAGLTYFNDYTMMRAMEMDFGEDDDVKSIADQYMLGPSLLVAPVYTFRRRTREVYLPGGAGWYEFYSGKYFSGGSKIIADAPVERIPLFVKAGSVIPVWPGNRYPENRPSDPLTFFIYTGKDCAFTLYEDEGDNYNYEKGICSTIKISYNNSNNRITMGDRTGEFPGMLKSRIFNFILVTVEDPIPFDPDAEPQISVRYDGKEITFNTGKIR